MTSVQDNASGETPAEPGGSIEEVRVSRATPKNSISFEIGGRPLYVSFDRIEEITHALKPVSVPNLPPDVLGIAAHRGNLLALVDPGIEPAAKGYSKTRPKSVILRSAPGQTRYAFTIDRLTELEIQNGSGAGDDADAGPVRQAGQDAALFDIDSILQRIESSLT